MKALMNQIIVVALPKVMLGHETQMIVQSDGYLQNRYGSFTVHLPELEVNMTKLTYELRTKFGTWRRDIPK